MNELTTLVKEKIKQNYKSTREFSKISGIPYTTISSALKKGLGGTAVETVIKMCEMLDIDITKYTQTKKELDIAGDDEQARLKLVLIKLIDQMDLKQLHKFSKIIKYANLNDDDFERLYGIAQIAIPDLQDK